MLDDKKKKPDFVVIGICAVHILLVRFDFASPHGKGLETTAPALCVLSMISISVEAFPTANTHTNATDDLETEMEEKTSPSPSLASSPNSQSDFVVTGIFAPPITFGLNTFASPSILNGKGLKAAARALCFLSMISISVEACPIARTHANATDDVSDNLETEMEMEMEKPSSSPCPSPSLQDAEDPRLVLLQDASDLEVAVALNQVDSRGEPELNEFDIDCIHLNGRSDSTSSSTGESPNNDSSGEENNVGPDETQGVGTAPQGSTDNGSSAGFMGVSTTGPSLSTRMTQATLGKTTTSSSTLESITATPTALPVTPTTEDPSRGEIKVDGKINASFELIIPSGKAVFSPQETAPSSPGLNPSLPTLLNVYEAGSTYNNNNINNYTTCEPDDDAGMLKLLSGLLAAILFLYLMNTIKSWYTSWCTSQTGKCWYKDWKMSLPGMPPPSSDVPQPEYSEDATMIPYTYKPENASHRPLEPHCALTISNHTTGSGNGSGTDESSTINPSPTSTVMIVSPSASLTSSSWSSGTQTQQTATLTSPSPTSTSISPSSSSSTLSTPMPATQSGCMCPCSTRQRTNACPPSNPKQQYCLRPPLPRGLIPAEYLPRWDVERTSFLYKDLKIVNRLMQPALESSEAISRAERPPSYVESGN
ncbi:hypothetical protein BT96DRAFT_926092, partial [Gymnopus androsaceus JB14]